MTKFIDRHVPFRLYDAAHRQMYAAIKVLWVSTQRHLPTRPVRVGFLVFERRVIPSTIPWYMLYFLHLTVIINSSDTR